jgi:hypothetical protein
MARSDRRRYVNTILQLCEHHGEYTSWKCSEAGPVR